MNLEHLTRSAVNNLVIDLRNEHGHVKRTPETLIGNKKQFKVLHLNIRSIIKLEKRIALLDYLESHNHCFDLVFLNETWLKTDHTNAEIEHSLQGYTEIGRAHV